MNCILVEKKKTNDHNISNDFWDYEQFIIERIAACWDDSQHEAVVFGFCSILLASKQYCNNEKTFNLWNKFNDIILVRDVLGRLKTWSKTKNCMWFFL